MRETIYDWTARRAGPRITVMGRAKNGEPVRIVGVDYIDAYEGEVVAHKQGLGGGQWKLALEGRPGVG